MDPNLELAKERHRNLTIWKEAMALRKAQMHFGSDAQMPRSVKIA